MIDLLSFVPSLKKKIIDNRIYLYDPIRKKYIVSTPEETVRQALLSYFLASKIYSPTRIAVEKGIKINNKTRRFDIVVFDNFGLPYLLVECKSPEVELSIDTALQIANYNSQLKCPYLMITNGIQSYCYQIIASDITLLKNLP